MIAIAKYAWGLVSGNRDWLTLIAVAAAAAFLYVKFETVQKDRDQLLDIASRSCLAAGATLDPATIDVATDTGKTAKVKKPRGQLCVDRVVDLAAFKSGADQETARILRQAQEDRATKSEADAASSSRDAAGARAAANRMEKEDAAISRGDHVDGAWFDALNDVAGVRRDGK